MKAIAMFNYVGYECWGVRAYHALPRNSTDVKTAVPNIIFII